MVGTPQTLNVTECEKLLNEFRHNLGSENKKRQGVRNFCMALLMLDAGLRVGEVVSQTISNLYVLNEPVHSLLISEALSHGNADRRIPLSQRIRQAIECMQVHYWSAADLHVNYWAFGAMNASTHITTRQVERIIRNAAMKSLGRPVHPHILRHTFATRLMRTTNARVVQELLGHQHITSTQIYTHPNQEDLKNAIDSLDQNQPNKNDTAARSTSTADITNGTDTADANRDMR